MSLPRYIINLEDIAFLLKKAVNDSNEDPKQLYSKGKQRTKGMRLVTSEEKMSLSDAWRPSSDVWITGIKIGVSNEASWIKDKIDLIVDGVTIFKDVYLKNVAEYKNMRRFLSVEEGKLVEVILHGKSADVEIWIDIDYIGSLGGLVDIKPPAPIILEPDPF